MRACLVAAIVGCLGFISLPASADPCAGTFTDVDSSESYCAAVEFIKDKGVTTGCTATTYCPNDYVTRAQMALFMQRLARGGPGNTLGNAYGAIGGGQNNTVDTAYAVVGGGFGNSATNYLSTVAGGQDNVADGYGATVAGGYYNSATATGSIAVGGGHNTAGGSYSLAAGVYANADQNNCVVFALWGTSTVADCNGTTSTFRIGATNGFSVDYGTQLSNGLGSDYVAIGAPGGHIIDTNHGYIDASGWHSSSDRNLKTDIADVDARAVLDKVAAMPMSTWRYKADTTQRHLGPMAQDFHAAFGLSGADDRHIGSLDEGGVALAAIKGLKLELDAERTANEGLRARLEALERAIAH